MLISEPSMMHTDPILAMIAAINGRSGNTKEVRPGVYEIGHFGSSGFLREYDHYPETSVGPYGVCDSVEQLLTACPELEAAGREFVVTVTPIRKVDEPADGGWRWHKWGKYIGTQNPQCEYIHDEPNIDGVLCFHIYERANTPMSTAQEKNLTPRLMQPCKEVRNEQQPNH